MSLLTQTPNPQRPVRKTREDLLREEMDLENKIQHWIITGHWPELKTCPPDLKPLSSNSHLPTPAPEVHP